MSTLSVCIKKAGKALNKSDADAIKVMRDDLKGDGVVAQEAAVQAVRMHIADTLAERSEIADKIKAAGGVTPAAPVLPIYQPKKEAKKADVPKTPASKPAQKIEDFGQKIGGAAKDTYTKKLDEALPENVKDITLAKHFPEPPYEQLLEDGHSKKALALISRMRDEIPSKPRRAHKLKAWGEKLKMLREMSQRLLDGTYDLANVEGKMKGGGLWQLVKDRDTLLAVGFPQIKSLKGHKVSHDHYSLYQGEKDVSKWTVAERTARGMRGWEAFDTEDEAIAYLRTKLLSQTKEVRKTKLDIWRNRNTKKYYIGKKVAARKYIDLKSFDSVKEARAYLAEHEAELLDLLAKRKEIPSARKEVNNMRVGPDYRQGKDVTPDMFAGTFGFRGVEFGNWVEQGKRQDDLNQAYDGLMDLSVVLGIPPRAISLQGTLGLAFGARGKGGKNPAKAHYEPGKVVINLTKKDGAGSLAHEWFHALDNYLNKSKSQFGSMSESYRLDLRGDARRQELLDSMKGIRAAIDQSGMVKRASNLDGRRTKDYWNTGVELVARSFERYMIDRLAESDGSSDYLANIVDEAYWNASEALFEGNEDMATYPYPTDTEAPAINAAYQKLFDTLKTDEQDGEFILFSKSAKIPDGASVKGMPVAEARKQANEFFKKFKGANDINVWVHNTQEDWLGEGSLEQHGRVKGGFDGKTLHLVAENIDGNSDLAETLRHEILAHKGLGVFSKEEERAIIDLIVKEAPKSKSLGSMWAAVQRDYSDQPLRIQAEELLAKVAEAKYSTLDKVWSKLLRMMQTAMERIGLIPKELRRGDLVKYVYQAGEAFAEGHRARERVIQDVLLQAAWHGSPHRHNKFSTSKIGTGEGAAAYGWGLYFAQKREIAEYYRSALSGGKELYYSGRPAKESLSNDWARVQLNNLIMDMQVVGSTFEESKSATMGDIEFRLEYAKKHHPLDVPDIEAAIDIVRGVQSDEISLESKGQLYTVDVPEDHELLDWDAPLSEQPKLVQSALGYDSSDIKKLETELADLESQIDPHTFDENALQDKIRAVERQLDNWRRSGEFHYGRLGNSPQEASMKLKDAGIPGLRYFDGDSQFAGNRTKYKGRDININQETDPEYVAAAYIHQYGKDDAKALLEYDNKPEAVTFLGKVDESKIEQGGSRNFVIFDDERVEITDTMFRRDMAQEPKSDYTFPKSALNSVAEERAIKQLDMFANADPYEKTEVRPDTVEAQREIGRSALQRLFDTLSRQRKGVDRFGRGQISLLGARLYKNFQEGKPNQLIGQQINSAEDLATLAQVYRDPRFETFRFIWTKKGEVVGESAITSRLPAAVSFGGITAFEKRVKKQKRMLGADGYYLLHNHPSGNPSPSRADLQFTLGISGKVPGFQSHVIVDHNEYSVLEHGNYDTYQKDFGATDLKANPEQAHPALGRELLSPEAVAEIGKDLERQDDMGTIILTDAPGKVNLLMSMPLESLKNGTLKGSDHKKVEAAFRRIMRESGSGGNIFLLIPDGDVRDYSDMQNMGFLTDVINLEGGPALSNQGGFPAHFSPSREGMWLDEEKGQYSAGGFNPPEESMVDTVLRKWQDKMRPLLKAEKAIEDAGGDVPLEESAYRAEEAFHGKTENDLRKLKETYLEPLADAMGEHDITREELDLYVMARHAEERNQQIAKINPDMPDGGSGMETKAAQMILSRFKAEGRTKALDEAAGHLYGLLEHQRTMMREGLQADDVTDTWESVYKNYVPLKGHADDESYPRIGRGFDIRGKESMRALGRRSMAESPVLHAIKDTTEAVIRRRKNEVGNVFLKLVEDNPSKGYWEIFTDEKPDTTRRVIKTANGDEVREMPVPMHMMKDQYFSTKRDGKTYFIKLEDKRLMRAMQNMGPEALGVVFRTMNTITRFLSAMSTSYNPEFMISNASRDIQTAIVNVLAEQDLHDGKAQGKRLVGKMVKSVPLAIRAIHASLYNKPLTGKAKDWQDTFDRFREDGAKTGWFDMKDIDGQAAELENMVDMAVGGKKGQALKAINKIKDLVEHANTAIENGVRLSVYKHAVDSGVSRKKAASLAKNLTVNFNRKGELGQVLNSLFMFANASIQGTATFARAVTTMKKGPEGKRSFNTAQKLAAGLVAGSFALALFNRMVSGDDDDGENWYDKVPQHVRERNVVIMKSMFGGAEGDYYTIPLPYGYNVFYNLGDAVEGAINSDTRSWGELTTGLTMALLGSFSPIGFQSSDRPEVAFGKTITPTVLSPMVQLMVNENFYGAPIYRTNDKYGTPKPDSALHKRSTKEHWEKVSRFLNEATGGSEFRSGGVDVSPDTLGHLFDFATGSAGAFYSRAASAVQKTVAGEDMEAREIPFYRKVSGKVLPYEDMGTFYDRRDEVNQLVAEYKSLDSKDRPIYREKYLSKIRLSGLLKQSEMKLKKLRQMRDHVESSEAAKADKQRRLQSINDRIDAVVDKFNLRYSEAQ